MSAWYASNYECSFRLGVSSSLRESYDTVLLREEGHEVFSGEFIG